MNRCRHILKTHEPDRTAAYPTYYRRAHTVGGSPTYGALDRTGRSCPPAGSLRPAVRILCWWSCFRNANATGIQGRMVPGLEHRHPHRRRRHQRGNDPAHGPRRDRRRPRFMEDGETSEDLLLPPDPARPRSLRLLHLAGSVFDVLLPGDRGHPEIFVDRHLGQRPERIQRQQTRPDAYGRLRPDPRRHDGYLFHSACGTTDL